MSLLILVRRSALFLLATDRDTSVLNAGAIQEMAATDRYYFIFSMISIPTVNLKRKIKICCNLYKSRRKVRVFSS
jgi:hypothetical protein